MHVQRITMQGHDHAVIDEIVGEDSPLRHLRDCLQLATMADDAPAAPQCDWPHDSQAFWNWVERH